MKCSKPVSRQLFSFVLRPGFTETIKFPDDITKVGPGEVSNLLGKYTALHCYALSELSKVNQDILRIESEERLTRTHIIQVSSLHTREKWRAEQTLEANPTIARLNNVLAELKVKKEHVATFAGIFDKYAGALSRELSRRASEMGRVS